MAAEQVQDYPFTTRSILVGHLKGVTRVPVQVVLPLDVMV